jgi:type II secretory pathway component PulF
MAWRGRGVSAITLVAIMKYPAVLYVVAGGLLLVFVSVVLPAVWSAVPARRRVAAKVLQQLLDLVRPG